MRSIRYLNVILTVIAVLLTLQLWTSWTGGPAPQFDNTAHAQAGGIPNAGAQRLEMINLLKKLNQNVESQTQLMRSGKVRVRVESGSAQGGN
jgi:hypothetical protein